MAADIEKRLSQLRSRRDGRDRMTMDTAVFLEALTKSHPSAEAWESRSQKPHTRYAIGAMQPVSETYTRVSIETAHRVANQLRDRLSKAGMAVEFRLQGSVPLDVHIRGVSDVDLLTIDSDFLTYMTHGAKACRGGYSTTTKTSVSVLSQLRTQIEISLDTAFPTAQVDKSGAKAVSISGGSLPRSVDVVPAHWLDSLDYQVTENENERGIEIYNKYTYQTIVNYPFLHISRIKQRCISIGGGLRKAIRLCKNVKADSDRDIKLPSFDIAAMMYHADMSALWIGQHLELAVLAETQRFLDMLATGQEYAKTLMVPDGSRAIFDTPEKITALVQLSHEMDDLLKNVYQENAPGKAQTASLSAIRGAVQLLPI